MELEKILEEIAQLRRKASENGNFNVAAAYENSMEIIRKHMNDGWISVEERLPEAGKKVLCYFAYEPDSPDVICDNRYIGSGMWESESDNVVAWMLRPEEYHPKRESKAWKENFLKKFNKRT